MFNQGFLSLSLGVRVGICYVFVIKGNNYNYSCVKQVLIHPQSEQKDNQGKQQ